MCAKIGQFGECFMVFGVVFSCASFCSGYAVNTRFFACFCMKVLESAVFCIVLRWFEKGRKTLHSYAIFCKKGFFDSEKARNFAEFL